MSKNICKKTEKFNFIDRNDIYKEVCKILSNAKLINSGRGVSGGYFCQTQPKDINVADIVEAIDGPIAITACVDESDEACETQSMCLLSGNWNQANLAIHDALKSVSLADLLNPDAFFRTKNENIFRDFQKPL